MYEQVNHFLYLLRRRPMKTLFVLALLIAIPAAGFSQEVQLVDGEYQVVMKSEQPEKIIEASLTGLTTKAVDVVGGTAYKSSFKTALAKGNSYRVDIDVTLTQAEFWLDFSTTQNLYFYVFESPSEFGTYTKIFETSSQVTGTGATWYSSGPIAVPLPKDNHYIIAVSWDGTLAYYYNTGDSQATSFGSYVSGYAIGAHPLGSTLYHNSNDQAIYYQRLTTEPGLGSLTVSPTEISAFYGGTFTFTLSGDGLGDRDYVLLGSATGTAPPMVLPGGATLDLAKDWFTNMLLQAAIAGGYGLVNGFIGTLGPDGNATATLILPGHCQLYQDIDVWFAWTTINPFDYQSNTVQCKVLGIP